MTDSVTVKYPEIKNLMNKCEYYILFLIKRCIYGFFLVFLLMTASA